jgi:hypothetical protein
VEDERESLGEGGYAEKRGNVRREKKGYRE